MNSTFGANDLASWRVQESAPKNERQSSDPTGRSWNYSVRGTRIVETERDVHPVYGPGTRYEVVDYRAHYHTSSPDGESNHRYTVFVPDDVGPLRQSIHSPEQLEQRHAEHVRWMGEFEAYEAAREAEFAHFEEKRLARQKVERDEKEEGWVNGGENAPESVTS